MTSVVTAQRCAQGYTWDKYLELIEVNKEHFLRNYGEVQLEDADGEFFLSLERRRGTPIKVLALSEDWCPDAYSNLPVMVKICKTAGWELRIFPRDENLDIMNQYLNQGKYMSIPVFVFFDDGFRELGSWIERSRAATEFMGRLREELAVLNLSRDEARSEMAKRRLQAERDFLRQETIRELREVLS